MEKNTEPVEEEGSLTWDRHMRVWARVCVRGSACHALARNNAATVERGSGVMCAKVFVVWKYKPGERPKCNGQAGVV